MTGRFGGAASGVSVKAGDMVFTRMRVIRVHRRRTEQHGQRSISHTLP